MPRNGSGTFTLVSGNPVVTGTTIESNWANTTLSDIATTLTDSLSRSGQGGMTAALRIADGTQGAPGLGFANETGTGLYRAGTAEMWATVQGAQTLNLDATGVTVPADKATSIEGTFVFNETGADKDARFEGDTDANLLFTDASTDRVGIGTNTPSTKLHVVGDVTVSGAVNATTLDLTNLEVTNIKAKDGTAAASIADSTGVVSLVSNPVLSGGTANGVLYLNGSKVATSGSALTFDGTNFGVGTSNPAAYGTVAVNGASAGVHVNATTGAASFKLYEGAGTGRGAVTSLNGSDGLAFLQGVTEGMRLTSTGLGIGTSSPSVRLDVRSTSNYQAYFQGTDAAGAGGIRTLNSGGSAGVALFTYGPSYAGGSIASIGPNGAAVIQTGNAPMFVGTDVGISQPLYLGNNGTTRATIDSSGNLGVGETSLTERITARKDGTGSYCTIQAKNANSTATLNIGVGGSAVGNTALQNNGYVMNAGNSALVFGTNDTERARITSGGDLLVGCTATPSATVSGVMLRNPISGGTSIFSSGTTNSATLVSFFNNNGSVGRIDVASSATSYVTSSDRRLKENIVPAPSASNVIDAIQIVSHDWKAAPDEHVTYGVIAQDLHAVAPQAVSVGDDGDEVEKAWGVDYSKLVPMLIKEIQSLRARVAALEAV